MSGNSRIHLLGAGSLPSSAFLLRRVVKGETPMTEMPKLPHHKLIAFGVARDLLLAVRAAQVKDAKLRDEALRSAKSACLNCAEGAGRVSLPDKARAFTIARGEACEAAAAVEVAALCGDASPDDAQRVAQLAHALVGMLTALIRRGASRASA
jgi:four helix bundle protein